MSNYTGLKYNDACGWYALLNGRICQPEIDGSLASARVALAKARPAAGGSDRPVSAFALIDWRSVEPLEEEDRCVWDTSEFLYLPIATSAHAIFGING
jgi:hypothetical protein